MERDWNEVSPGGEVPNNNEDSRVPVKRFMYIKLHLLSFVRLRKYTNLYLTLSQMEFQKF